MKRVLQIMLATVFLLSACSKEKSIEFSDNDPGPGGGSNTGYYFKCKIGGVAKTFNTGAMAIKQLEDTTTLTMILGSSGTDPQNSEVFALIFASVPPLTTGTYKVDDLSGNYEMMATYAASSTATPYITITGIPLGTPFRVNITSVSSTEIAGTFSGTLFEIDIDDPSPPANPTQKAVTEGEFKVKFQ